MKNKKTETVIRKVKHYSFPFEIIHYEDGTVRVVTLTGPCCENFEEDFNLNKREEHKRLTKYLLAIRNDIC